MTTIQPRDLEKIIIKIETDKKLRKYEKKFVVNVLKSAIDFYKNKKNT